MSGPSPSATEAVGNKQEAADLSGVGSSPTAKSATAVTRIAACQPEPGDAGGSVLRQRPAIESPRL